MSNSNYIRLKDIPQFPHANYRVTMFWKAIRPFFEDQVRVDLNPDFQRGYVWTQEQKERYIEYRLMGGMSGRILYFNCANWKDDIGTTEWHETLELVDGKQRLDAVFGFMGDKVKAFGKYLSEYEDNTLVLRKLEYDFEFHINNLPTKKEVIQWYLGLNNGGSVHTDEDLNVAREILKNCK